MLDAERHLAFFAVESQDNGFYLVALLQEVLSRAQVLRPRHFADVDKTFNTWSDFNKCTVVSHNHNFTLNLVTNLEVSIKSIPWMWLKLLQAQCNATLFVVEVEDNHVKLLVERNDFLWVVNTAPREVGDVNQTIYATKVDEYAIRCDVLNNTFKHLTFFEFCNDFLLLLFEFSLDECLVRYNNILEFLVNLNNLEFHCFADEYIIVADWLNVDLATWQECFDAEYVNNHTALSAALDVTLDYFVVFKRFVYTIPALCHASLAV